MAVCLGARPAQLISDPHDASATILSSLSQAQWTDRAYRRQELPERVLQFGTGMLLRALCAASVDAANRAGAWGGGGGRIVVVQSTPHGNARAINAQDGLFTLLERGLEKGTPVERTRLIGSISRALVADTEWEAVREVATRPELQVIVSNVTEAGFRMESGFPARLTDLLYARFERLPEGPPVFVIPTELVPDNGPQLAAMVDKVAGVREAVDHPRLGAFLRRVLFDEIIPATDLPADAAAAFARSVVERFRNPWLDHEWRVILTNQEAKMRIRVVPLISAFTSRRGRAPEGLALACAAQLTCLGLPVAALAEASRLPTFVAAVTRWKLVIEQEGIEGALARD